MSRQPVQDLQGLDNVASPVTSPVDIYTGTVAAPQQSSAGQLADALGTVSKVGQQAVAQQKADKETQDKDRLAAYLTRAQSEQKSGYVDAVKAGEAYADTSEVVVTTAVTDFHRNRAYNQTKSLLLGLDDDLKMDVVKLEAYFDTVIKETVDKTDGMDFVQSGSVQGARNAINEFRGTFSAFRNEKTKSMVKSNTEAEVFSIVSKYGVGGDSVKLVNALNEKLLATSPFSKTEDKQNIVDALIEYNKTNPSSNAVSLIKKVPFLGGKETDSKLEKAAPLIAQAGYRETQRQRLIEQIEREEKVNEKIGQLNALAESGDLDKVVEVQKKYAGAGETPAEIATANAIYDAAVAAEESAQVKPDVSAATYTAAKNDLSLRSSTGKAKSVQEEINDVLLNKEMHPREKALFIKEIPTLVQGNKIVTSDAHRTAFTTRLGGTINTYRTNQSFTGKNFNMGKLGLSFEDIAKDVWNSETQRAINLHIEKHNAIPTYTDLHAEQTGIYDIVESKVRARLQEVNQMTTEQLKSIGQQPQPKEQLEPSNDESPYSATYIINGVEYGLPVGIDPATATDDDWQVVGEPPQEDEVDSKPVVTEEDRRLADLVTTVFRAENDPSLTQNKGSRAYTQAINELKKIPEEELNAFVEPLAEKAIVELTERLNPDSANAIPYTQRDDVQELIERLQQNPANIFSDDKYAERFLEKTLK